MKVKYKKIERMAGLFMIIAFLGVVVFSVIAIIKKGIFENKIVYKTKVLSADGLREGAPVTISGIRAGEITNIELLAADDIVVYFEVSDKYKKQIHSDSRIQIVRPFVIGDRSFELTVGDSSLPVLEGGSLILSETAFDIMDLVNGKKLGPFLGTLQGLMNNVSTLAQAFADPKRTVAFVKMFDRMDPLIFNLNRMSQEVTRLTSAFNEFLPQIRSESPEFAKELSSLVKQLNEMSATVLPSMREVGPQLPEASKRAVEALDQMVITLKAIQKSFLLSGNVKEVKKEEADEKQRQPAAQ